MKFLHNISVLISVTYAQNMALLILAEFLL